MSTVYQPPLLSHLSLSWVQFCSQTHPKSPSNSPIGLNTSNRIKWGSEESIPKVALENFPITNQGLLLPQSTYPLLHVPPCIPGPKLTSLCSSPTRRWLHFVIMLLQGTLPSSQSQILFIQHAGSGRAQPPTHLHLFPSGLASAAAWGDAWQSWSCKWLWPR